MNISLSYKKHDVSKLPQRPDYKTLDYLSALRKAKHCVAIMVGLGHRDVAWRWCLEVVLVSGVCLALGMWPGIGLGPFAWAVPARLASARAPGHGISNPSVRKFLEKRSSWKLLEGMRPRNCPTPP